MSILWVLILTPGLKSWFEHCNTSQSLPMKIQNIQQGSVKERTFSLLHWRDTPVISASKHGWMQHFKLWMVKTKAFPLL